MRRPSKVKYTRFPSRRRNSFFKPYLEILEDRRLLSAGAILQGTVINDQTSAPQSGATVTLTQPGNSSFTPQTQMTGANGSYSFTGLTPGTYQLLETPPSGNVYDSTTSNLPPGVVSVPSSPTNPVSVTIASQLAIDVSVNGNTLSEKTTSGTVNPPVEILTYVINGQQITDDFVGQIIASANGETAGAENTPTFNTFCIDLAPNDSLNNGSNDFVISPQTDLSGIGGQHVQVGNSGEIAYLYNTYGTGTLSNVNAAALQVAIWSLEYNADPTKFDASTQTIPSGNYFYLTGPDSFSSSGSPSIYSQVVAQAQFYISDAAGKSGQALFLAPGALTTQGSGEQGVLAPLGSITFSNVPQATPALTTQASENGNVVGSAVMSDTATLSGGNQVGAGSPAPTITFNLIAPNGSTVYTETQTVTGTGNYTTTGTGTGSDVANQVGTYYWVVTYSGNTFNSSVTDNGQNQASEQETTVQATPALTTQGSETAGGVVGTAVLSDTATLSGGYQVAAGSPAPTLTFSLIAPNGSTAYTETQTVTGTGNYTTTGTGTGSDVANQVGTYYWVVTYSGNSFNNSVTDNGQNQASEQETTVKATPSLSTQGSETAGGVVGTAVLSDTATLSGGYQVAAGSPAPTLTFSLIAPNGSTVYTETQTVTGTGNYTTMGTGTGSDVANQVGTYYWVVTYSGNTFNSSVTDNGQSQASEQLTTVQATPGLTTQGSETANGVVGTSVLSDTATLSGGYQVAAGSPAPTLTFSLIAPNGSTVYTEAQTVTGTGNYTTTGTGTGSDVANQIGTYYWIVTYSGNTFNSSVTDNGQNQASEQLTTVQATPALTTQASENGNVVGSAVISDTATLSGGYQVAAGSPAPTLTFQLIAPNGSTVYTETQTVTGTGNYTTTGTGTGSDVANQVGTYYWVVAYSGNTFNSSVTDNGQSQASEQLTTVQATPGLTTQGSENGDVVGSAVMSDTATLSGGYQVAAGSPAPTLTFQLIAPNGSTVYTETQTVTGTGNYTTTGNGTGSDVANQVGTYYWVVTYSGNTFNSSVTHNGQNDTSEQETTVQATPSLSTQGSETAGGVVGTAVLSDTATLSGGYQVAAGSPAPTITFNLIAPNGSTVYTETQTVTGDTSYTTTGTGTGSDVANQVGTYYWVVTYSGNSFNSSVTHNGQNDTSEQETTVQATPQLTTQASETAGGVVGTSVISDTATLSGGYQVAAGSPAPTLTFQLIAPNGSTVYTETQTVTGTGNYTTTGTGTGSDVANQVGTYYWIVTYSGNTFNSSVTDNGQNQASEQETTVKATPAISTTQQPTSATVGSSVADTATVTGLVNANAGDTVTFNLYSSATTQNSSTLLFTDTETVSLSGGTATATSKGFTTAATGTDYWVATFNGDSNNSSVTSSPTAEPVTITKTTPAITTTQQPASATAGSSIADKATVTGLVSPNSSDTVTFNLYSSATTQNSSTLLFTDTETVSLSGGTATATSKGFTATATGTDYWVATFNGDSNNSSVTSAPTAEPVTITSAGSVSKGEFATIGFWHNKNGQAVINSFNGGSTSTALGNWLATNFPNLFGTPNPYDSATLAQFHATSFAGLTNAQIATVYANLWNPSGVTKNTYVQAFAVALGIYADTSSLSGTNTLASQYGFIVTSAGFGSATYNIGSNGAAFGFPNNTALTVYQILTIVNNNFNPTTGTFYGGDQTKTSDANNVLNGINTTGDISASVLEEDSSTDSGIPDQDSDVGIIGTESPDGVVFVTLAQAPTSGQKYSNLAWAGSSGRMALAPNSTSKPHAVDVLFANDSWLASRNLRSTLLASPEDLLTGQDEGQIGKLAMVLALISGAMLRSNAESRSRSRTAAELFKKPEKV